jgi:hypothetical protein
MSETDSLLLDEDEQNRLTEELQCQAAQQTNLQRKMFYFAFAAVAAIFVVCFVFSLLFPWEMNHQVHFKEEFPHWWFLVFYIASIYSFGVSAAIVKVVMCSNTHVFQLIISFLQNRSLFLFAKIFGYLVGAWTLIVWLTIFHRMGVTNPILYWMPFANLGGILLATYVDYDTNSLLASAESLDNFKYNLKGV